VLDVLATAGAVLGEGLWEEAQSPHDTQLQLCMLCWCLQWSMLSAGSVATHSRCLRFGFSLGVPFLLSCVLPSELGGLLVLLVVKKLWFFAGV
jgi:hypothetical protein